MSTALEDLTFVILAGAWSVVAIVSWIRYLQAQREYLSHFPPVNGYPLQEYFGRNPWDPIYRAINTLVRQRQENPEVEALRQRIWRRLAYLLVWVIGLPSLVFVIVAFLIVIFAHPVH